MAGAWAERDTTILDGGLKEAVVIMACGRAVGCWVALLKLWRFFGEADGTGLETWGGGCVGCVGTLLAS